MPKEEVAQKQTKLNHTEGNRFFGRMLNGLQPVAPKLSKYVDVHKFAFQIKNNYTLESEPSLRNRCTARYPRCALTLFRMP